MANDSGGSGVSRMFEYKDGKSDKFWAIECSGNSHTVRYGRSGTDGQTKTKEFADEAKALASCEKLIAEKVRKGYVEVEDETESRSEKIKAVRALQEEREPFIKEILSEPDNPAAYAVYADWLEERGDLRAELIRVQLELEDGSVKSDRRKTLKKREQALLKKHSSEWLEDLATTLTEQKCPEDIRYGDAPLYQWEFARGFLDTLTIDLLLPAFGTELKRSPHVTMLRRMVINDPSNGGVLVDEVPEFENEDWDWDDAPGLDNLVGAKFQNLRELIVGDGESHHAANVHKLIANMPRLETLELEVREVDTEALFKLKLPELRSLTVHHQNERYALDALAANSSMGKLESINIFPHMVEPGDTAYIDLDGFRALCQSKHLKSLKFITLNCSDVGDDGLAELVKSPLLGQLRRLDLTYGRVSDTGARTLAEADLSHLESLSLTGNYLTSDGISVLKKAMPRLQHQSQYSGDPDAEQEYLWHGDME